MEARVFLQSFISLHFFNPLNTEFPSVRSTSAWANRATGNLIQMVLKNRPTCHFYVFEHFIRFNQYIMIMWYENCIFRSDWNKNYHLYLYKYENVCLSVCFSVCSLFFSAI